MSKTAASRTPAPIASLSGGLTFAMAAATGVAVANIYYNQPMLAIIHADFAGQRAADYIATATQLGFAAGLVLLVPLGDLMDRRRLIVAQFVALAVALCLAAAAPSAWALVAASVAVGVTGTVAQQIVPFAASLARPERRGQVVGTVMSGLLCGLLLSRTVAGFVASHLGWRDMFWIAVPLSLLSAVAMALILPRNQPHGVLRYGTAMASMVGLWRTERALRFSTLTQASLFASFSAFWTILAFHLQQPPFDLDAEAAGFFGIVAAGGIFAAPLAGKVADSRGPALVVRTGALLAMASWLVFWWWGSIAGLVVGVVVIDLGIQLSMISNQQIIFALHPDARSRLNTVFMTGMFLGGAIGSAGATIAWSYGGWSTVCLYGLILAAIAVGANLVANRKSF